MLTFDQRRDRTPNDRNSWVRVWKRFLLCRTLVFLSCRRSFSIMQEILDFYHAGDSRFLSCMRHSFSIMQNILVFYCVVKSRILSNSWFLFCIMQLTFLFYHPEHSRSLSSKRFSFFLSYRRFSFSTIQEPLLFCHAGATRFLYQMINERHPQAPNLTTVSLSL